MISEAFLYGLGAAILLLLVIVVLGRAHRGRLRAGGHLPAGRVIGAKGPGLFFIVPLIDRMVKVSLLRLIDVMAKRDDAG